MEEKRPNILVFMTDQQNATTIDPAGMAIMPNMERFLRTAVRFTEAYTVSPHCCPSRASFFSGLYPSEHGVWHNVEVCNAITRGLYDNVTLFPQLLQKEGYNTIFSGKWHVSAYEGPEARGFDTVLHEHVMNYGRMSKENIPHHEDWAAVYSGKIPLDGPNEVKDFGRIIREGFPTYHQFGVDDDPFGDRTTVQKAKEAILSSDSDIPFFIYAGTTGPHDPYMVPQEFLDLYKDVEIPLPESFRDTLQDRPALYRRTRDQFRLTDEEHQESIRHYLAFCSFEDALFGELLDALESKGIYDDTVIVYLTDHGDYMGAHGLWAKGLPCFQEAYRICAAIKPTGSTEGRTEDAFVSIVDFTPTILDLAKVSEPYKHSGYSLLPFLQGITPSRWRTEIYTQTNGNEVYGIQRAVWNRQWKYVFNTFDYDELYDLAEDPAEMTNRIKDPACALVVKEMCGKMWKFARQRQDAACTCPYIMVSLAPYGPGLLETQTKKCNDG